MQKQKRIMFLGGITYIIPAIKIAHNLGYYVITADYLPNNPAHKYADEYVNVSIIDKDAVLRIAKNKKIDGIISYAVDPGVVTAAYVAEKLNLPNVGPYESVKILQDKCLFRQFLLDNGFNVPKAKWYSNIEDALNDTSWLEFPIIVKPADGSGSKGVTRVNNIDEYEFALRTAFEKSIGQKVIVEEFIEMIGFQSGSDSFSVNGKFVFFTFDDQLFDPNADNPYTPSAHTWPSTMPISAQMFLQTELQRLISLLRMRTSLYNIETRVGKNGKPYIMEVSPRAGGNRLAEILSLATGVDLIKASVLSAVGECIDIRPAQFDGFWAVVVLHSHKTGKFIELYIDQSIVNNIVQQNLNVSIGDNVYAFTCASNSVGSLFMKFESKLAMEYFFANQNSLLKLIVE